jgi:uncharacterized FAD-dependent dehydrogenase
MARKLRVRETDIRSFLIQRKSVDARKKKVLLNFDVQVIINEEPVAKKVFIPDYKNVSQRKEVLIVGSGPAGLFTALRLLELGIRPIILERGKDVQQRKKDIAGIIRTKEINEESNYCFGEGGAGTFSDGKLYTRSKKRGNVRKVLNVLHYHGAGDNILYESHPHIGSDKLPGIISEMRKTILDHGGVIKFGARLTDMEIRGGRIKNVILENGEKIPASVVVLAAGHSARDIYKLLVRKNIQLEQKSFAMGLRVEHPQQLINSIQYHNDPEAGYLPSAEYKLVSQVEGRGVFSFCMCPGGFVIPSATSREEVVINGMSPSHRNTPFANSGIVVEIRPEDLPEEFRKEKLGMLDFQKELEKMAFLASGSAVMAPAQRLMDFLNGSFSNDLPENSYTAGLVSSPLHEWMPEAISNKLKKGFLRFGEIMRGYLTDEALLVGVESRTSSPVRIPRDLVSLANPQLSNIFPCGEGAGYSGGIVSSAIDGERCADAVFRYFQGNNWL